MRRNQASDSFFLAGIALGLNQALGKLQQVGSNILSIDQQIMHKVCSKFNAKRPRTAFSAFLFQVEMAGIEPASERFDPRKSTSVAG